MPCHPVLRQYEFVYHQLLRELLRERERSAGAFELVAVRWLAQKVRGSTELLFELLLWSESLT